MKLILRFLLRLLFSFRSFNEKVLSAPGPVLLVPNHVSWLDFLFVGVCLDDDWKFVTSVTTAQTTWLHRRIMINRRTFPIDATSPYAVKRMAEFLAGGGRLVLFAEGRISLTGSLMKIFDGTGFLLHKTGAKVITAYLRGANRIPWVRHTGWTRLFTPVSIHFGELQSPPTLSHTSTSQAREQLTEWLRQRLIQLQFHIEMEMGPRSVLAAVASMAARRPRLEILEDLNRQPLNYRKFMAGRAVLAQQWAQRLAADQTHIGLLLPNVNGLPLTLVSLWTNNRIPAILNFSSGVPTILACAQLAGLKTVITSRRFLERARLDLNLLAQNGIQLVYLEDIREHISALTKLAALIQQWLNPQAAVRDPQSDTAVILFTSGSEGQPKGVELTHRNLLANIRQILAITDIQDSDRLFNALPLFHSFGLTIGTLLPLVRGLYTFLYPSPLHYRMVPVAVYDRYCTIFLSTNTFLNGYARKAHPYDFASVRYLFAGAEKIQEATAATWSKRFGLRILEGYGATECSPCISVNTAQASRPGTTGQFLPGMEYRIESVEGVTQGGRLLVKGPNIMRRYLNPDADAKFQALGGWYDTGDIVEVDQQGFIHILGRLKRFAKVSGEMVSLTAVEDALAGAFPQYGLRCQIAVVTRPDEEKGEALIAVTNEAKLTLDQIRSVIRAKGMTNLCVPREIQVVREIPKLGTGKVNHRALLQMMNP